MPARPDVLDLTATAKRIGIKKPSVLEAVDRGRLKRRADGRFDLAAVDAFIASRGHVRGGARRPRTGAKPLGSAPAAPAPATATTAASKPPTLAALPPVVLAGGIFADRAAAELARDSYMARLRQLEYEEKAGRLVEVAKVQAAIFEACNSVRTRLLAIPVECAPAIARLKTPTEVQDALTKAVVEALEELSISFASEVEP